MIVSDNEFFMFTPSTIPARRARIAQVECKPMGGGRSRGMDSFNLGNDITPYYTKGYKNKDNFHKYDILHKYP